MGKVFFNKYCLPFLPELPVYLQKIIEIHIKMSFFGLHLLVPCIEKLINDNILLKSTGS